MTQLINQLYSTLNSDYNMANHQGAHLLVFGWNWLGDTAGWGHIKLVLSNKVKSQLPTRRWLTFLFQGG